MSTALLLTVSSLLCGSSTPLTAPPDVRGFSRGVDAAAFDPAAPADAEGFALQYRHRLQKGDERGQLGAFAVLPMGALTLHGGYEWLGGAGVGEYQRGSFGVALGMGDRVSLGVAYRGFSHGRSGSAWDVGLFGELFDWLTLSMGVDGFNSPEIGGVDFRPAYVMGASLRPVAGAPWLTLGAEGEIAVQRQGDYEPRLARAVLDVVPLEGLHALAGYQRQDDDDQVWFGLSISLDGIDLRATALGLGDDIPGESNRSFTDGMLAFTLDTHPSEALVRPTGRTVEIVVAGDLSESGGLFSAGPAVSLIPLKLERLRQDPTVGEVIVRIGRLDVGLGTVDELRAAIAGLRESGKKVTARITGASDKAYMVAAACDTVEMDPSSTLYVNGFAVAVRYFAGGLSKLGVRFDSVEIGRYKSGPDPLTRTEPRTEDREVQGEILAEAHSSLMVALTKDRGLADDKAEAVLTKGIFSAAEALAEGLVDELTAPSDPNEVPGEFEGGEPWLGKPPPTPRWGPRPVVAVVPVAGTIVGRAEDNPLPGQSAEAGTIVRALEAARKDENVIGVVMRVESPGGDVLASDIIWRSARRLAEEKPLVVSMGDVAASGGYYVAAPAHKIFAEPNTITGSIGVFTLKPDFAGLYHLLGINSEIYKKGELADWDFSDGPLGVEARARVTKALEAHYDTFVGKVAAGRGISIEEARKLGEGRVYTGRRALELGLVDAIGGMAAAVEEVKQRAQMATNRDVVVSVPSPGLSLRDIVLTNLVLAKSPLEAAWADLHRRARSLRHQVFALMPMVYDVEQ